MVQKKLLIIYKKKAVKHNLRYIFEPNQGVSYARNQAINAVLGKYLAYLDDDEKVSPEWCQTILRNFKTVSPRPDVIGGPTFPFYPQGKSSSFDDALATTAFYGDKSDFLHKLSPTPELGYGVGNCAYKLATLKKYNGFDPLLGRKGKQRFSGEETDLFKRMYADGAVFWYEASMIAYHNIPFERTRWRFQFIQGIHEGMSNAIMEKRPLTIKYIIKASLAIISMPARVLSFIIGNPVTFPRLLFRKLNKEGNHIGYFWQQCKAHIFK